jgi:hypothetical protein
VISAQKANTANAFSLPKLALSTANLYAATQPGGSLFGLQLSNPVSTDIAYSGNPENYGQANDPMVGGRIGGVNVFGGGLGLYNSKHNKYLDEQIEKTQAVKFESNIQQNDIEETDAFFQIT